MKKILFAALALTSLLFTSCENDDIVIDMGGTNPVSITVSLSDFFSCYDFTDTKHDISQIPDFYRTFHSEGEQYIQTRVLIYNSNGMLVDSILTYNTNTNSVSKDIKLAEGKYTAVATLTFADKDKDPWWTLIDKESLNTVYIKYNYRSWWNLMSYAAQEFTVSEGNGVELTLKPKPVGALCYVYYQNFQYASRNDCLTGKVSDNGVRNVAVYTQNLAIGYRLNPKNSDKYIYLDDAGTGTWYYLHKYEPEDFDWTYFQTNLYGFFYILAPRCKVTFGYILEGDDGFNGKGEATYDITTGETYLAYWDWIKVGNPYFGIADNNHWNSYGAPVVEATNPTMFVDKTTARILESQAIR